MPHRFSSRRRPRWAALLAGSATLALVLSGCSTTTTSVGGGLGAASTPTEHSGSIDNCGTPVKTGSHPTRIVTIKSSATELLLALGLEKRIVGTAFLDGPLPSALTAHGTPPSISEFLPSQEAVLKVRPDFVYGGWESNFSPSGAGDRASLAGLGVGTYVSPSACKEAAYVPDPLTFATVFREIEQAGAIFGASRQADALVAEQKKQLRQLDAPTTPVSALWYSSGSTTPYVGAGIGAPEMIMRASGLSNIFAGVHDTWSSVSWEAVAAANPKVIVLVDASWSSAQKKMAQLANDPVTQQLDAVVNHRYIVLPFASTEAGVRNVAAAASVISQLKKLNE